jgi:hypothetical protein
MNLKMPGLQINNLRISRFMVPMRVKKKWRLSMNRRICRQVLDCGDGVFGVTALAGSAQDRERRRRRSYLTQSGDFEDSVAALQDAGSSFPVHGSDARPMLEIEALHKPQSMNHPARGKRFGVRRQAKRDAAFELPRLLAPH